MRKIAYGLSAIAIWSMIGCSFIYDENETRWKDVNNSGNVEENNYPPAVPTAVPTVQGVK